MSGEYKISVCCIVYNHEKFIEKCLMGFLSQKVNCDIEFLIHDDASTDNTQTVIKSLVQNDPRFVLILREKNIKSTGQAIFPLLFEMASGEYVALCEGDDYWTDPYKLQKQIDFLDSNPDCVGVSHYSSVLGVDHELINEKSPKRHRIHFKDVLLDRKAQTRTVSMLYRKKIVQNVYSNNSGSFFAGDRKIKLLATQFGAFIQVLPFYGAVYRHHAGGVWSMVARSKKRAAIQNDYLETHKHFVMPFGLKVRYVWHHFLKTLPGDVRYGRLYYLWQTLTAVLIRPKLG